MEGLILQISIAAIAVAGLVHNLLIERYQGFLLSLCKNLPTGRYKTEIHPQPRLWRKRTHSFHTFFHNRSLVIRHTFQPDLISKRPGKDLEIHMEIVQKFWLRLLTDRSEIIVAEDIQLGDFSLDERFLIHSNQPDAAKEFLKYPYVRQQIDRLKFLFSRMEFHQGLLKLQYSGPVVHSLRPESLQNVLEAMVRIADSYETRSALFSLIIIPVQKLCPYCRAALEQPAEQIVKCQDCRTRIHRVCWEQNGQCTTYGCQSRNAC